MSDGYSVRVCSVTHRGYKGREVKGVLLNLINGNAAGGHLYIVEREEKKGGEFTGRVVGGRPKKRFGAIEVDTLDQQTQKEFLHREGMRALFDLSIQNGADVSFLAQYLMETYGTAPLRGTESVEQPRYPDEPAVQQAAPAKPLYRRIFRQTRRNGSGKTGRIKERGGSKAKGSQGESG